MSIKNEGVLYILKIKHGIVPPSLAILATVYGASEVKAVEVTVKSQAEIDAALASITEDTTIKLDPTYSSDTINMDINTTHNVTIDGNNKYLKGESDITDNSSGNITVKNILMDGKGEDQQGRDNIILNINVENGTGKFLIEKSKFKNARSPEPPDYDSIGILNIYGQSGTVDVKKVLFEKNSGGQSGGIYSVDSKVNIKVDRSAFNRNESYKSANGAIMMNRTSNEINITNSKF